jgi:hypothetical protein
MRLSGAACQVAYAITLTVPNLDFWAESFWKQVRGEL